MINTLLKIENIQKRAGNLNCELVEILGNVILCHRIKDNTFITWRLLDNSENDQAEFISGCYDMNIKNGIKSLIERSGY